MNVKIYAFHHVTIDRNHGPVKREMDGKIEKNSNWESKDVSNIKKLINTYLQYILECQCTEMFQEKSVLHH
jgi:hypothetical protein